MLHIPSNFRAGAPISQVPMSWFVKVANFINNLVAGYGIKFTKTATGASIISLDPSIIPPAVSAELGDAPQDMKDAPVVLDTNGAQGLWAVGGENGLELDVYCKVAPQTATSSYTILQRVRICVSKGGLITKVEMLPERTRIKTSNS